MSSTLENLKKDLVKKEVALTIKIAVDEDVAKALDFLESNGLKKSDIIVDSLGQWRRKGVVGIAKDVKKELGDTEKFKGKNEKKNGDVKDYENGSNE